MAETSSRDTFRTWEAPTLAATRSFRRYATLFSDAEPTRPHLVPRRPSFGPNEGRRSRRRASCTPQHLGAFGGHFLAAGAAGCGGAAGLAIGGGAALAIGGGAAGRAMAGGRGAAGRTAGAAARGGGAAACGGGAATCGGGSAVRSCLI